MKKACGLVMRRIILTISLLVLVSSPAGACDFKKLFFGASASQIIDQYNLNSLEMDLQEMPKKGEFTVREMGSVVCNNLPENSFIKFIFIDDTLVKVKIINQSNSQNLLSTLKDVFGENDDSEREKSADGKTKIAMWDAKKMSVLYSFDKDSKGSYQENANISSKAHDALFQKIIKKNNKAIDQYLKESGKGKYSKSYPKGNIGSSNFNSNTNSQYDPDALEKLKNSYDKSNEAWKERNESNPRKGR